MKSEWLTIRGMDMHIQRAGRKGLPAVVLLHGFTGSVSTWHETAALLQDRYSIIAVDLTGHGLTAAPAEVKRYTMEEQTADLHELLEKLAVDQPVMIGYSMGGRIALSYAVRYPHSLSALILESSSPGLRTLEERASRRQADNMLAERIEKEGMEWFIDYWQDIPLFHSQKKMPEERQAKVRGERLHQRKEGLANSLRGIGTGSQPSNWERLQQLAMPVCLLTGSEDDKFIEIADEMEKLIPNACRAVIKDAGHAIHVEKPVQFATMVKNCLKTMID